MEIKKIQDSYIYLFFSFVTIILNLFFIDYLNEKYIILILIFFVIFFGLPHGALDTLLAKQNNLYNNFYSFILFNLLYLSTILLFFFLWFTVPVITLSIFLLISIIHFSEDWKQDLNLFQRLALATSVIGLTIFFQTEDIKSIFLLLTNSQSVDIIILFFKYASYLLMFFILFILFSNLKKKFVLLNIITIFFTSWTLNPLLYFLCYFCFFHSIKNYRDSTNLLNLETKKVKNKILILNLFLTLLLSLVIFNFYLNASTETKLIQITFIGLASLTVPHMILKGIINYKNK